MSVSRSGRVGMPNGVHDDTLAFLAGPTRGAPIEIRVNFGLHAGREATHAEVDRLAKALYPLLHGFAIVALRRHELEHGREAVAHQVHVEVEPSAVRDGVDADGLPGRLLALAEEWARDCIDERSSAAGGI